MPKSIMAAIDLAVSTDQVLDAAKEYSKAFSAKLYLVHVTPEPKVIVSSPPATGDADFEEAPIFVVLDRVAEADRLRQEHKALQDLGRELSDAGIDVTALSIEGVAVTKLLQEIERLGIDLVIIGSHAPSFLRDIFVGSRTKGVVRGARCPVLVLPPA